MEKASISIILPTYNVEKYIGQCLNTIFTQSWPNIECIIVDDCCTDRSIEIAEEKIKSYKAGGGHIEFKIVRHEKNRGAAAARNTGMDAASGDYLWWVDPDDYIAEDAVFDLLHGLGDERPDIIAFGHSGFMDNDSEKGYEYFPNKGYTTIEGMLSRIFVEGSDWASLWRKLFRRGFLIENGIKATEGVQMWNDIDFYVNMIGVKDAQIKNDSHCCYFYRQVRPGSIQSSKKDAVNCMNVVDRYVSLIDNVSESRRSIMIAAAARRILMAFKIIVRGMALDMKASRSYFKERVKAYRKVLQESSLREAHRLAGRLQYPFYFVLARYRIDFVILSLLRKVWHILKIWTHGLK